MAIEIVGIVIEDDPMSSFMHQVPILCAFSVSSVIKTPPALSFTAIELGKV